MAKQLKDQHWLKQQLVNALHWDEDVAEGIIDLIVNAASPSDVEEITAAYMDNNPVAVCAISDFIAARQTSKQQPQAHSHGSREQQLINGGKKASNSNKSASKTPLPASQASGSQMPPQEKWLKLGGQPSAAEQGASPAAEGNQQVSSVQQAEATLSMFRKGGRLKSRPAAGSSSGSGSGRRKGEQLDAITSKLERKVANCLHCGKIFDCRSVTNDIMRFIDSGFKCTFCGAAVAMSQQQRIQQAQQHGSSSSSSSNTLQYPADDAQAKAVAFKDRLVEYDRHSHKRTTVIDDQSDFFEIDTNAWLTEEERAELRRRAQLAEEAAAARRNKVIVTLDLLGRKVVMTDGSEGSMATGGDSSSSSFEVGSSATHQLLQQVQAAAGHTSSNNNAKQQGSNGSSAVQQGGAASEAGKAPAETLADALEAISNLRISANPGLTATPVFVSKRRQQLQQQQPQQPHAQDKLPDKAGQQTSKRKHQKQQQQQQQQQKQQQKAGESQKLATAGQHHAAVSAAANRAAAADRRVQDDSIFGDFEAELLCDELLQHQPAQHVAAT